MSLFDFGSSLSGLRTQAVRLSVSADNIANARSVGVREDGSSPVQAPYVPQQVTDVTTASGGVRPEVTGVKPPSVAVYQPESELADAQGLVPYANVDIASELVGQVVAQRAYEANLSVIRTKDEMAGSLLDTLS